MECDGPKIAMLYRDYLLGLYCRLRKQCPRGRGGLLESCPGMGVPGLSGLSLQVLTGGLLAIDCALGAFTPYQRAPREPCRGRLAEGAVPDPTCPPGVSLWVRVHLRLAFLPSCSCGWVGRLPLKGQEQPSLQYGAGGADCLGRVLVLRSRRRLGLSQLVQSSAG